eukprot:Gb_10613 [translate_table: standard]
MALDNAEALQGETQIPSLHHFSAHTLPVTGIVSGYGGCSAIIVSSSLDFTCKIWSLALGLLLRTIKFPAAVNAVVLDPGEYALYAGCTDGKIYVAALNVGTTADSVHGDGISGTLIDHSRAITTLAFSLDGVSLVSGSEDCTVRVWDTVSCQVRRILKHAKGPISSLIIVPHLPFNSNGLFADVQGGFVNKHVSFLAPVPLSKYSLSRAGNFDPNNFRGPPVILPSHNVDSVDGGCFNTLLAMKQQIKELQQQGSSAAIQMELERLRSEYRRSLHMIQQWQQVYQDLHYFCVNELMGGNKPGEDAEETDKSNEKGKKGRGRVVGKK